MKILHVNEHFGTHGGAETYVTDICAALGEAGWEPVVVAAAPDSEVCARGVRIHAIAPSFGIRSTRRAAASFKRILEMERPDVVHLHNIQYFMGNSLLRLARRCAPVVQTVHDTRAVCPRWQSKILPRSPALCTYPMGAQCFRHGCFPFHRTTARALPNVEKFWLVLRQMGIMRKLDRVIVHSEYMREQLLLNGFSADRIVKLPLYPSHAIRLSERRKRSRRIVFVGRIDETKGIRELLQAVARLRCADWSLHLAGDGPFLEQAKAVAHHEKVESKVEFLGRLDGDAVTQMLASAYVVVLPSLVPESYGLVGLEALACGTPVVGFDSGGVSEWLKHGKTGFLVPRGDVPALTERLERILADEQLAETLGRQGLAWATQFDRAGHLDQLCDVYRQLASNRLGIRSA